jgi:Zn-finger protein
MQMVHCETSCFYFPCLQKWQRRSFLLCPGLKVVFWLLDYIHAGPNELL